MTRMLQLKLVVLGLGAGLVAIGFDEFKVGEGASPRPQPVELAEIEAGRIPDNSHLEIGAHWMMGHEVVFRYTDDGEVTEETKIDYSYYPALSHEHSFFRQLDDLAEAYGSLEGIPDEELPAVESFAVLVKTKRFATVGALPETGWAAQEPVAGLVVNRIRELGKDEAGLLAESFPGLDLGRVLILEQGREPASAAWVFGMMGGGAAIFLAGTAWLLWALRPARPELDPAHVTPTSPVPPIGP